MDIAHGARPAYHAGMNKTLLLLAAVAIAGCAAPRPLVNVAGLSPSAQDVAECELEATKASAAVRNGLEAGYVAGTVRRQCMAVKGFK